MIWTAYSFSMSTLPPLISFHSTCPLFALSFLCWFISLLRWWWCWPLHCWVWCACTQHTLLQVTQLLQQPLTTTTAPEQIKTFEDWYHTTFSPNTMENFTVGTDSFDQLRPGVHTKNDIEVHHCHVAANCTSGWSNLVQSAQGQNDHTFNDRNQWY